MGTIRHYLISAAAALGLLAAASPATALVMSADLYNDPVALTDLRGTISSSAGGFEVLVDTTPTWDATAPGIGGIFTVHPPNEANETTFVNDNRNGGDAVSFSQKINLGDLPNANGEDFDFMSTAEYILLKIGGGNSLNVALIHNLSGGALDLNFSTSTTGSGLSHYTEFGMVSTVPIPAALPLFLGALSALGFMGWRRRRSLAA